MTDEMSFEFKFCKSVLRMIYHIIMILFWIPRWLPGRYLSGLWSWRESSGRWKDVPKQKVIHGYLIENGNKLSPFVTLIIEMGFGGIGCDAIQIK